MAERLVGDGNGMDKCDFLETIVSSRVDNKVVKCYPSTHRVQGT
jgi:hypothetical protein